MIFKAILVLLTAFIILPNFIFAEGLDYSSEFGFRSRPLGATLAAQGGYSKLLWGSNDQVSDKKPFLYGYIRPNARIATSAVVNKFSGNIDIYPISILGFTFGYTATHRGIDAKKIDCIQVECRGWTYKKTARVQAVIGVQDYFLISKLGIEYTNAESNQKDFTDEYNVLVVKKDGDENITNEIILGKKFNEEYLGGFLIQSSHYLKSGQSNRLTSVFAKNTFNDQWSLIAGSGIYESTHFIRDFVFFTQLTWTGIPKIGFF